MLQLHLLRSVLKLHFHRRAQKKGELFGSPFCFNWPEILLWILSLLSCDRVSVEL